MAHGFIRRKMLEALPIGGEIEFVGPPNRLLSAVSYMHKHSEKRFYAVTSMGYGTVMRVADGADVAEIRELLS